MTPAGTVTRLLPEWARGAGAAIVLAAACSLVLSGCGSPSTATAQGTPQPTTAATVSTPPTDTTAPGETATPTESASDRSAYMLGVGYKVFGHFLANETGLFAATSNGVRVFLPGTGLISLDSRGLFPDKDVLSWDITSIGNSEKPQIAVLVNYRVPAQGLTPEKYATGIGVFDPLAQNLGDLHTIISEGSGNTRHQFAGSAANTVVVATIGDTSAQLAGYDAPSGTRVWSKTGESRRLDGSAADPAVPLSQSPAAGTDPRSGLCRRAMLLDAGTGRVIKEKDQQATADGGCATSGNMEIIAQGRAAYLEPYAGPEVTPDCFVVATGASCKLLQNEKTDLSGREVFRSNLGPDTTGKQFFGVLDSDTGAVIWALPPDRASALKADFLALYGDHLYLKTTDQTVVVNLKDGTSSPDTSGDYPVGSVDGWVLWNSGLVEYGDAGAEPAISSSEATTPEATPEATWPVSTPSPTSTW